MTATRCCCVLTLAAALVAAPAHANRQLTPRSLEDVGVDEKPGAQVPLALRFADSQGREVALRKWFDGETPVIMILTYSTCRSLCNLVLRGVSDGVRQLALVPGDDYRLLAISIDPGETPERAAKRQRDILRAVGRDGQRERWPFLTGRQPAIAALAASVGFRYRRDPRSEQYVHPAVVFVLTGDGRVSRYLYGVRYAAADLTPALAAARAKEIARARDDVGDAVLNCFRFDPASRRYGRTIQLYFRVGAAVIFGGLVILLLSLYRWERRRQLAAEDASNDGRSR